MLLLKKVRYKNFLSTGNNFIEYNLNTHHLSVIYGKNGSGKTQTLDAIFYCLYNKPYREINKPELINDINKKDMIVEVEFEVNGRSYKVCRGMKPNIFHIYENDVLKNQESSAALAQEYLENNILKLNYKSFTQTVILGAARYIPFPKLVANDRRKFVENILDIEIFSTMSAILKDKISNAKEEITKINYAIDILKNKQSSLTAAIRENEKDRTNIVNLYIKKIEEAEQELQEANEKISALQRNIIDLQSSHMKNYQDDILFLQSSIKQIEIKCKNLTKEIRFYNDNNMCPTCTQVITDEHKHKHIDTKSKKLAEYTSLIDETNTKLAEYRIKQDEYNSVMAKIAELERQIVYENTNMRNIKNLIQTTKQEVETLQKPNEANNLNTQLVNCFDEMKKLLKQESELNESINVMHVTSMFLKDNTGIKTKIIKQYIPVFNKTVNFYLQQMNFFCEFNMTEDFDIKIKINYQEDRSYFSISAGQQARIDLAILFAWRYIAFLRSSVSCNLLFLDEVLDGHLDTEGVDDLIKIIQDFTPKENVFIVTHKMDQINSDKFDNIIKVELHKKFTVIK
jgi:DNA repair exonuclease SbcCD ATPase subunit